MSIPRQLPLPDPRELATDVRDQFTSLYTRLRNWVNDVATQLGNFQDTPVSNAIPTTGQALVFDGRFWAPGNGVGGLLFQAPLTGTKNGANTTFTFPFTVQIDANGIPQVLLFWGHSTAAPTLQVYVPGAPASFQWTLSGNDAVLGQAPMASDNLFAFGVPG